MLQRMRGFTLIEVLLVVVLVSMTAALVAPLGVT
jgi:prepilin-type N-terminal cleavage/methylation domain-containing protein